MKRRTVYWLPSIRGLVLLSALLMACSGLIRIAWAAGEEALPASILIFQVLLPLWANLCFVWILFLDGRERLYRSAIPVWLGCVFFAVKAFYFVSILHTVLCLLLYALVAVLYTATVTGFVPTQAFLWPLFGLPCCTTSLWRTGRKQAGPFTSGCRSCLYSAVWRRCCACLWPCAAARRTGPG